MLTRLLGFTILPLASLVTPLLLLPVIARTVGEGGWASIVAGQSIGTFAATLILWGWNVDGPVRAARSGASEVAEIYRESLRTRWVLAAVVAPLAGGLSALIAAPEHRLDAVVMSFSTAVAGLSPAWVAIGLGQPRLLALFDTAPRVAGTVAAIPLILATGSVLWYGVLLLAGVGIGLAVFARTIGATGSWLGANPRSVRTELGRQRHTAAINVSGNAYAATPVPLATALNPAPAVAGFASADNLYRFGLFSVVALGNALQQWTVAAGPGSPRQTTAIRAHAALGVVGAAILTGAGPWASSVLFGPDVQADSLTCAFYGAAFLMLSSGTPLIRNILIPAGHQKTVLRWTAVSAALGVAAMAALSLSGWVPGVALGMAVSETVLLLGLIAPSRAVLRSSAPTTDEAPHDA
jgi:hypothetical protein